MTDEIIIKNQPIFNKILNKINNTQIMYKHIYYIVLRKQHLILIPICLVRF